MSVYRRDWSLHCAGLLTFFFVLQLLHDVFPLTLLTGRGDSERAFTNKRRAGGIERRRDATLLLPPLLSLQTSGKRTSYCVAETLTLPCRAVLVSEEHVYFQSS